MTLFQRAGIDEPLFAKVLDRFWDGVPDAALLCVAINRPKHPWQKDCGLDDIDVTYLTDGRATELPREARDHRSGNRHAYSPRVEIGPERRHDVGSDHHQIRGGAGCERDEEPVKRIEYSHLRRRKQGHAAKNVRVPQGQMT